MFPEKHAASFIQDLSESLDVNVKKKESVSVCEIVFVCKRISVFI